MAARVVPRHARRQVGRESLEPRFILISDPRLVRPGDGIHPQQVGAAIRGEAQTAREDAHRETGERHLEARAVGFHAARRRIEGRARAPNVRGRSCRAEIARRGRRRSGRTPPLRLAHFGTVGHHERRVPEGIPAILVDDLLRDLDAGVAQRLRLLLGHAPDAARDAIFGRQVLTERGPLPACFPDRQIAQHRLPAVDRVPGPQFSARLAGPCHNEQILIDRRREPRGPFVLRQVALERVGRRHRHPGERQHGRQQYLRDSHAMPPVQKRRRPPTRPMRAGMTLVT